MIVLDVVLMRMAKAVQYLSPTVVDVADYREPENCKPEIVLRVVTDNFKDIRNKTRDRLVMEMVQHNDPEMSEKLNIVCQCLTEREYRLFKLSRDFLH
jgi:hypothetical protein